MSDDDRTFERRARAWLELGPVDPPAEAVQAALLNIESIDQERDLRIPWRFPAMNSRLRLAAAAVVGVLAVGLIYLNLPGGGDVGPPNSSQSVPPPTSTPGATDVAFDPKTLAGWIVFEFAGKEGPDGSTLAGVDDRHGLWLIHADGSGLHELAPGVPANGKISFDISPDGTHVAFATFDLPGQIWEVGIEGGAPQLLSTDCNGQPGECLDDRPAYSADGGRLAFVRGDDHGWVVAIRDLANGTVTLLEATRSTSPDELAEPSWSPDGKQIAYEKVTHDAALDKVTDTRIFIVNADNSGLHELALPAETPWGDPDWSPVGPRTADLGTRIVFGSYPIRYLPGGTTSSPSEVYSVRPDGTDLQQLTNMGVGSGAPSWTSDGSQIVYWGWQSLYIMDAEGANEEPINRAALAFNVDGYGFYGQLQPTP